MKENKENIIAAIKEDMYRIIDHIEKTGKGNVFHDWDNRKHLEAVVLDVLKFIEDEENHLKKRFEKFVNHKIQRFILNFCIIMSKNCVSSSDEGLTYATFPSRGKKEFFIIPADFHYDLILSEESKICEEYGIDKNQAIEWWKRQDLNLR